MWEAEQHVPYDINDVSLDFEILGDHPQDDKQMQVLLVAAKKDMVLTFADLIREAGLTPVIIDVDSFAIQNALAANYDFAPDEVVAILNIGAEITNINIVQNGVPVLHEGPAARRPHVRRRRAAPVQRHAGAGRPRRCAGRTTDIDVVPGHRAGLRGPRHRARARAGLPAHDR